MRNWIAGIALVAQGGLPARLALVGLTVIAVGGALLGPGVAAAETREFVGSVVKINETKIVVSNRMKDTMDFIRSDATVVTGDKSSWKQIRTQDRVSVSWDVADKPRRAHQVKVMPPDASSGDE